MSAPANVRADFSLPADPPLLKKVEMYNAGCIQPLSNYERDLHTITQLNSTALRIDLSAGKSEGTAGKFIVGESFVRLPGNRIDPASLTYDFSRLDGVVRQISEHGVLPYMSWCYVPYPLQQNGDWTDLDTSVKNWQEVWEEIYYRYAGHYTDLGIRVGYHEIYNEPDLEMLKKWGIEGEYFVGFLDLDDFLNGVYRDMYLYGARGILRADPDATVGGPAFAIGELGVEDWVGFLSTVKENSLPLDFFSFHTYFEDKTWFVPQSDRERGERNRIERVVEGLSKDRDFLKTAIHVNEFSYLNSKTGINDPARPYDRFAAAADTLDTIMEAVGRTSIQQAYWAQYMSSTFGTDPYSLIDAEGNVKASFNAVKIYNDMPVWRYGLDLGDSSLNGLAAADRDKLAILVWNAGPVQKEVALSLDSAPFASGLRRVYRIDGGHGSYFDAPASAALTAEDTAAVSTDGCVWSGTVPAKGVVYLTVNRNGKEDFTGYADRSQQPLADYVKVSYLYEDRYRGLEGSRESYGDRLKGICGSYSHFDRAGETVYLGMGNASGLNGSFIGQAHASCGILCEGLPERFTVEVETEGCPAMNGRNTALSVRVDFCVGTARGYAESILFHNGLYDEGRDPAAQDARTAGLSIYPWGTEKAPDTVISLTGGRWEIDLSDVAPKGWSGRAMLSFDMQNTGPNTRAVFRLKK